MKLAADRRLGALADTLWVSLRQAARSLRRSPGFAAAAIATMTLGIAASITLVTIVHTVLLKPLPYRDSDRLVVVQAEQDFEGASRPVPVRLPADALAAWPSNSRAVERIGLYSEEVAALDGPLTSELIDASVVSAGFFETLGGEIALGRPLGSSDDGQPAVVVSARLWRRLFPGAEDLQARSIGLNGQPVAVVGVAADSFQIPQKATDVWIPAGYARIRNPSCCGFLPIARLSPGATPAEAAGEIGGIARNLADQRPRALGGVRVRVVSLHQSIVGDARPALLVLTGAAGLFLLLACANVANLLLARHTAQAHETAVRRALGASPSRLVLQSLAESALLTGTALIAGTALTVLALRALAAWPVEGLPRLADVAIDRPPLLLACAVVVFCTAFLALVTTPRATGAESLGAGQRRSSGSARERRTLRVIAVAQLAISMVLLVGAMLLGRSLVALLRTDLGVTPQGVATASLNLSMGRSLTDEQQIDLVDRVVARVSSLPGVVSAGVGTARPPDASRVRLTLNRTDDPDARASFQAAGVPASPGYFAALGVRLERGRFFTAADRAGAPAVVMMSADTAGQLFGDRDPLGRTIVLPVLRNGAAGREEMTVVGITANVKYAGLAQMADAVVYRPFAQQPWRSVFLVVRVAGDPGLLAAQLQREIASVDRAITVADVTTMDALLADATSQPRFRTTVLIGIALIAALIAAVGLYGLIAYSVSQRTAELGIRMALGADGGRIRRMVMREGLGLVLAGATTGAFAAYAGSRLLTGLLFGIEPGDATSFLASVAILVATGLLASHLPASRAARADPLAVLRSDH
jgi:putative ABC transport system permease protein